MLLVVTSTLPTRHDGLCQLAESLARQDYTEAFTWHLRYDGAGCKALPAALVARLWKRGVTVIQREAPAMSGTSVRVAAVADYPTASAVAFMDDDIAYPPDYLRAGLGALKRQRSDVATVSFHGKVWTGRDFPAFTRYSFLKEQKADMPVDAPGVGVSFSRGNFVRDLALHQDLAAFKFACDLLFGFAAWQAGKTAMLVRHPAKWLKDFIVDKDAVCRTQKPFQAEVFKALLSRGWLAGRGTPRGTFNPFGLVARRA